MDQKQETTSNFKKDDFETIGNFLKKQREQQEIPLKIISRTTKISTTLLDLLEGDELSQLPNKAYVKGFVKSYCKALSINQKESLNLLEKTYLKQFPQKQPNTLVKEYSTTPSSKKPKAMTAFFVLAIGIVISSYLVDDKDSSRQESSYETISHQSLTIKTPLKETKDEVKLAQNAIKKNTPPTMLKAKKDNQNEKEKTLIDKEVISKKETKKVETDEKAKKYTFSPIKGELFTYKSDFNKSDLELLPKNVRLDTSPQKVFIKAMNGETWITYKVDDKPIRQLFLKKDKNLFIKGKEMRIFLGNINATKIFVNNKPISYSSRTGVKSLVIPKRNTSKYKLPLFVFEDSGRARTSEEVIKEKL
ncbi:MAG: hypothetical protein CME68_02215 [Halobacteriovoraceae bacterium]|nr:hypothetical protein [Halobacteriovoraceae bacterium]